MNKTNKRIAKTFWVTGSGKLRRRRAGQNHFNSRERGNTTTNKRRDLTVAKTEQKLKLAIRG
ncbi:MAG: hypothetical protein A3B10_04085 [Candidatus Doudnabacteria bacterium RIFCSPLOWO2_01_FULL_44_21]|uniref:50S ribosomal protein L35 n=1 Tax=Candidatus Doudnabacteria bacterium RIFCSPLOWO2_01_FULL_44_21 TaxID=1817841 RepID=A0A1F5Q583_9BACT|nr:MAG: hypothetical protein A3B95_00315 [Candidatus Doudnabacteria bacterium RIFCSPHIGHO2_02_FULL_43_13b]OGE97296.1 MAG: hypothetical protein A3B10_04085 [Candidatus Doudnabacteria bacterium RIFCSPLOWO2_01_FULL_44_21]